MEGNDAKVQLERERFEYEKLRNQNELKSTVRRLSLGLGIAGAIVSLITGSVQFWIGNDRAEKEGVFSLGKVLLEHGPKIYSTNPAERTFVIEVIKMTSPNRKVTDTIFAKFASATKDVEIQEQLRAAQTIISSNTQHLVANTPMPIGEARKNSSSIHFSVLANERRSGGYLFTIAPHDSLAEISSVIYKVNHPSFKQKVYEGDKNSGFSMQYAGWGAVDDVTATITLKSGAVQVSNIDMISELGW